MVEFNKKILDQIAQHFQTTKSDEISFRCNGLALIKKNLDGSHNLSELFKQHSYQQLVINIEGGQIVNIQQIIKTKI